MCHWEKQLVVGTEKVRSVFLGISSQEVVAVCLAHKVPRVDWHDTLWAVRIMASAAAKVLNAAEE